MVEILVKPNTPMFPTLSSGRKDEITLMKRLSGIVAMDPQLPNKTYENLFRIKSW